MMMLTELTGLDMITIGSLMINVISLIIIVVLGTYMITSKDKQVYQPISKERRLKGMSVSKYENDTKVEIHTSRRGFQYSVIYDSTGKLLYYGDNHGQCICYI